MCNENEEKKILFFNENNQYPSSKVMTNNESNCQ